MKPTKEKIIEVLRDHSSIANNGQMWVVPDDEFDSIASELESLQEDKTDQIIKDLSGEKIEDIKIHTSTEYHLQEDNPRMSAANVLEKADDYATYWRGVWKDELKMTRKQMDEATIAFARGYTCCQTESQPQPTDEEIKKWANNEYGCSGTQAPMAIREVNIAIKSAKAMRDGKIGKR